MHPLPFSVLPAESATAVRGESPFSLFGEYSGWERCRRVLPPGTDGLLAVTVQESKLARRPVRAVPRAKESPPPFRGGRTMTAIAGTWSEATVGVL